MAGCSGAQLLLLYPLLQQRQQPVAAALVGGTQAQRQVLGWPAQQQTLLPVLMVSAAASLMLRWGWIPCWLP